jgi:FkbM family methyltransferase
LRPGASSGGHLPEPGRRRALSLAFRRVWGQRGHYRRQRDWWLRYYNGVVNRFGGVLPLPGRGKVWELQVRGLDGPVHVRQGSADWGVLKEVVFDGEYDFAADRLAGEELRQIVDLGANVGLAARYWLHRFPGADLIAVEPSGPCLEVCRRNVVSAPGGGRRSFVNACVSDREGSAWLDISRGPVLSHLTRSGGPNRLPVECLSVDQVLARGGSRHRIDLVKCDVEGSEREIFRDCSGWIRRVRYLVVELHGGYRHRDLEADLRRGGAHCELLALKPKRDPVEVALFVVR